MVRLLLIVALTLSASLSGAVGSGHVVMQDHDHSVIESAADDLSACCDDSAERAHTCLTMPAMFEGTGAYVDTRASGDAVFDACGLALTGIQPSGPTDPPRML